MRLLKHILINISIVLFVLILIETPFRVYDYFFKYKSLRSILSKEGTDMAFDEIQVYLLKTGKCIRDPNLIWRNTENYRTTFYQFNSLGLRTIEGNKLRRSKGEGIYRIIVFGGSHPFGVGVRYEHTYAQQLEKFFKREQQKRAKTVQVINAAVPGYSTLQVLNLLKYQMIHYEPDLIIIDAGINDGILLTPEYPWKDIQMVGKSPFLCKILNLAERSSFFWYFRIFLTKIIDSSNIYKNKEGNKYSVRVPEEESCRNLEEMKESAHNNSSKIIFLSQMYLDNTGELQRSFGTTIEPFVDIYAQLKKRPSISKYFLDNIHASEKGHKEIARIIFNYLISNTNFFIKR